jgi:hypothetical protein
MNFLFIDEITALLVSSQCDDKFPMAEQANKVKTL